MSEKTAEARSRSSMSVKELAITAICIVLVYVFTAVVNVKLPIAAAGGLIHLGNVPLFVAAILFGKRTERGLKRIDKFDLELSVYLIARELRCNVAAKP